MPTTVPDDEASIAIELFDGCVSTGLARVQVVPGIGICEEVARRNDCGRLGSGLEDHNKQEQDNVHCDPPELPEFTISRRTIRVEPRRTHRNSAVGSDPCEPVDPFRSSGC